MDIGGKSPKNLSHSHLARSSKGGGGDPLRIFRRVIPCQKVKSWSYQDPAFALLYTIPAVIDGQTDGQTDRHVAVAKTALCIASREYKKLHKKCFFL